MYIIHRVLYWPYHNVQGVVICAMRFLMFLSSKENKIPKMGVNISTGLTVPRNTKKETGSKL